MNGFELGPAAPLFFLSYAHSHQQEKVTTSRRTPDKEVSQLFAGLSYDVGELIGRRPGMFPGFMDTSMKGGELWSPEVMSAVATCQVFIPLLSPSLFDSEWCGREWSAFSSRAAVHRQVPDSPHMTAILPVLWMPMDPRTFPPAVAKVQMFWPGEMGGLDLNTPYRTDGLYGLLRAQQEPIYSAVIWRLAKRVVDVYRTFFVNRLDPIDMDNLGNPFERRGE